MSNALILQAIVSGLLLGGVYSLICVGLTLTFGVMRIINFAHGEFLMVAMYATYFFAVGFKTESYAAIIVVLPGLFLFGVLVFHFLIRPIQSRDPLNQMLLLVGLSLVLQNGALALFSPRVYWRHPPAFVEATQTWVTFFHSLSFSIRVSPTA